MRRYSASQLENFERCPRLWWFGKVARVETPPTPAMLYGTELHRQLENWVNTGATPEDPRAAEAIRVLGEAYPSEFGKPLDRATLRAEGGISVAMADDHSSRLGPQPAAMIGFVDVRDTDQDGSPMVLDWKSRSDVAKYAKTEHQIAEDLQLNVYAKHAMDETGKDVCTIAHIYLQTKKKTVSRVVSTVVTRPEVQRRWAGYLKIVKDIETVRAIPTAGAVEGNKNACNDFGGCAHRSRCAALEFDPGLVFSQAVPEDEETWGPSAPTEAPVPGLLPPDSTRRPPGAPAATPLTIDPAEMPDALTKAYKEGTMNNPLETAPATAANSALSRMRALAGKSSPTVDQAPPTPTDAMKERMAAAPSGAPTSPPPPSPAPDPAPAEEPTTELPGAEDTQLELPGALDPDDAGPGMVWAQDSKGQRYARRAELPIPAEKAKTSRRKAAVGTGPEKGPKAPPMTTAEAQADREVQQAAAAEARPAGSEIAFLYVDCLPMFGFAKPFVHLGEWLKPITETLHKQHGFHWAFHEFRKAQAVLQAEAAKWPLPECMVVTSNTPEAGLLLNYLISKSATGTRGCA